MNRQNLRIILLLVLLKNDFNLNLRILNIDFI